MTTTNLPTTSGTRTSTMVSTSTISQETNEKLKSTEGFESNEYESDSQVEANTVTDPTTSITKGKIKPRQDRKCNGPPCLTPYVTTVRGETRDFHRILQDLNNNHVDSHSSDFLIRK